ncbi:Alpha/Beta hydrolase protein [Hyaloscypha finlandica]|nr:Alpha/Beta hydrolase protein [Hyaloscypha finlandica]
MATADATGDATIMGTLSDEEPPPSKSTTIVNPLGAGHTHTVIFLHGREDFGEYMAEFLSDKSSDGRTLPENEQFISQWFDVWDVRNPEEKKELAIPGLRESIRQILEIIEQEAKMVPMERIILGGLSQGCATAILTLLSSGLEIGAFIASNEITCGPGGGIPSTLRDVEFNKAANILSRFPEGTQPVTKTPVFLAHSEDDDIVPFELGNDLHQIMKRLGFNVTWKKYKDGGHWIQPDHGLDDMCTFLEGVMKI